MALKIQILAWNKNKNVNVIPNLPSDKSVANCGVFASQMVRKYYQNDKFKLYMCICICSKYL